MGYGVLSHAREYDPSTACMKIPNLRPNIEFPLFDRVGSWLVKAGSRNAYADERQSNSSQSLFCNNVMVQDL